MTRRAAKVDDNHSQIVDVFRVSGASVQSLAVVGFGCPDLVVGFRGRNYLVEVKDGSKPPSRQQLTADESDWHLAWHGQVCVVNSVDTALRLIREWMQQDP